MTRIGGLYSMVAMIANAVALASVGYSSVAAEERRITDDCSKLVYLSEYKRDVNDPKNKWFVDDNDKYHCDRNVRNLTGNSQHNKPEGLMSDINWTLTRYPNHYPCLTAAIRYQTKQGFPFYSHERDYPSAECYAKGALKFWPEDSKLWFLLGYYYQLANRPEDAVNAYDKALEISPSYLDARYNLGLLYTDLEKFDEAMKQATIVYGAGYPLAGLRNRLKRAQKWNETQ